MDVQLPTPKSNNFPKYPKKDTPEDPMERAGMAALTVFMCTIIFSSLMYYPYTAPLLFYFNDPGNCLATVDGRRVPDVCSIDSVSSTVAATLLLFLAGILSSCFIGWKAGKFRTKTEPFIVLTIVSIVSFMLVPLIAFMWGFSTLWLE